MVLFLAEFWAIELPYKTPRLLSHNGKYWIEIWSMRLNNDKFFAWSGKKLFTMVLDYFLSSWKLYGIFNIYSIAYSISKCLTHRDIGRLPYQMPGIRCPPAQWTEKLAFVTRCARVLNGHKFFQSLHQASLQYNFAILSNQQWRFFSLYLKSGLIR